MRDVTSPQLSFQSSKFKRKPSPSSQFAILRAGERAPLPIASAMTAATAFYRFLALRSHIATSLFSADAYYHLIEALFFLLVIYLAVTRAYLPWNRRPLPPSVISQKIADWKPAPLASPLPEQIKSTLPLDLSITPHTATTFTVNGKSGIENFATNDFLNLLKHPRIERTALNTMRSYGCGACGPRGFYGTTDLHLQCEDRLARFCSTENAILYSFGAATANSTIPAFAKRGDLLVVDEALNFSLMSGVQLSRANVKTFKHNDMQHLEHILKEVTENDATNPALQKSQRRIIIIEGIYQNIGDVCPLDKVIELKDKYLFRVMLDESFSLGVLGSSGKGALELFDVPRESVDIATADLGNAVAAVGGFCVGNYDVVNHQRLSGAGYCFSASQPPFLASAATEALDIIEEIGTDLTARLRENIELFREKLGLDEIREIGWYLDGDSRSPLMHLRSFDDTLPLATFTDVQKRCLEKGILVGRPVYAPSEVNPPKPCVRITISAGQNKETVERAGGVLRDVLISIHSAAR